MDLKDIQEIKSLLIDRSNLDALAHLIIDNSDLNYKGNNLRISNEDTILQFIKYLYPKLYNDKLQELKKEDI